MRYTVKDLLESGQFPEMKLISGESELNREIKGARLLEVANMECFLSGDEILFTSFKGIRKCRSTGVCETFRGT